ncbi:hypothetical protein DPMN_014395, partial [Dreissena polymorpha]
EGKGGVMKKLVKAGFKDESFPSFGDRVTFTYDAYIGTEINQDQKFDSTADEGKMFSYESLKGKIIRGLEMGVLTMEKGEHAIFTIQPEYAFGEAGIPGKPGKAVVTFDTKVIDIECPDFSNEQDKSIVKKIITHGVGFNQANFGCKVTIDINLKTVHYGYHPSLRRPCQLGVIISVKTEQNLLMQLALNLKHCQCGIAIVDSGFRGYESGMNDIGDWDNNMAAGMMTLEEESAAFGEIIPETGGNHGINR